MIIFSSFLIWKNILKLKKNEHIIFIFYWNKKTGGEKKENWKRERKMFSATEKRVFFLP